MSPVLVGYKNESRSALMSFIVSSRDRIPNPKSNRVFLSVNRVWGWGFERSYFVSDRRGDSADFHTKKGHYLLRLHRC